MKSDNAKKGISRAPHRSLFYAMGYTDEELEKAYNEYYSARSYIRYTDSNGLERVYYNNYTGNSVFYGGCSTSFAVIRNMLNKQGESYMKKITVLFAVLVISLSFVSSIGQVFAGSSSGYGKEPGALQIFR